MDFNALMGRAAQYSPDAMLIVQQTGDDGGLVVLYANPVFHSVISCCLDCEKNCTNPCTCELSLTGFSHQSLLKITIGQDISHSFRVSITELPESETNLPNCFLLTGRPTGDSLSEGRERLYSNIARKFIDLEIDNALSDALRTVGLYFDVARCFAARVQVSTGATKIHYYWDYDSTDDFCVAENPIQPMCDWVMTQLRNNEMVQVDNITHLPPEAGELSDVLRSSKAKAALLAPVLLIDDTLWVIGIHCLNHTRRWTIEDVTTFKVVGDLLGNAFSQTETVWSLKETERRFQDAGANIPGVVFQMRHTPDNTLNFSYISQGIQELAGLEPASIQSNPELLENLILREDRGRYRKMMKQTGEKTNEWSLDIRIKHPETQEIKWLRSSGRTHKGANNETIWNGLLLDVSERHKAEETMRISEERLRRILGSSPIAIGISDVKDFKILFANKQLAQMYQVGKADVIGYDTRKFYAEPRLHRHHWVKTQRQKHLRNVETKCKSTDGRFFWAQITTRLIDYGGRQAILWWAFDITEHKQTKEALAHLAHHDPLTGLTNRRLFEEHLQKAVSLARRTKHAGVLFYFDLDGFKDVNDQFGHNFGDWVLKQVALRLLDILRDSDIAARLGGDEFAIIAHGIDDIRSIESVISKMQKTISAPYVHEDRISTIGLSIGVVRFFGNEKDIQKIVMMADGAMYDAKQSGKGTYRLINMPPHETTIAIS